MKNLNYNRYRKKETHDVSDDDDSEDGRWHGGSRTSGFGRSGKAKEGMGEEAESLRVTQRA